MAGSRTDRLTSAAPTICKIVVKVSIVIKTLTNVCFDRRDPQVLFVQIDSIFQSQVDGSSEKDRRLRRNIEVGVRCDARCNGIAAVWTTHDHDEEVLDDKR
jgi:hypothetical protein